MSKAISRLPVLFALAAILLSAFLPSAMATQSAVTATNQARFHAEILSADTAALPAQTTNRIGKEGGASYPACAKEGPVTPAEAASKDPSTNKYAYRNCLPMWRWQYMPFHTYTPFDMNPGSMFNAVWHGMVMTNLNTALAGAASAVWNITSFVMDFATQDSILRLIGQPVDMFVGKIMNVLLRTPALALAVFVGIAIIILRASRNGGVIDFKRLGALLLGTTLLVVMGAGASGASSAPAGTAYQPPKFSPTWVATKASNGVKIIADPVAASSASLLSGVPTGEQSSANGANCWSYIDYLNKQYTGGVENGAIMAVMSQWWVRTTYTATSYNQYGVATDAGPSRAMCQQLEMDAGISGKTRSAIQREAWGVALPADSVANMQAGRDDLVISIQQHFWAFCDPSGVIKGGKVKRGDTNGGGGWIMGNNATLPAGDKGIGGNFANVGCSHVGLSNFDDYAGKDGKDLAKAQEQNIFAKITSGDKLEADAYKDFGLAAVPNGGIIDSSVKLKTRPGVSDVVRHTLSIKPGFETSGVLAINLISVLMMCGAILVMSLVLLVIQVFAGFMGAVVMAGLAYGVMTLNFDAARRSVGPWFGMIVLTSVTALLMSIVFFVASVFQEVGAAALSIMPGTQLQILWLGICPLLALLALNRTFKKVFRAASPFSLSGMKDISTNPRGIGLAAGGAAIAGAPALMAGGKSLWSSAERAANGLQLGGSSASANAAGAEAAGGQVADAAIADAPKTQTAGVTAAAQGAQGATAEATSDGAPVMDPGPAGGAGTSASDGQDALVAAAAGGHWLDGYNDPEKETRQQKWGDLKGKIGAVATIPGAKLDEAKSAIANRRAEKISTLQERNPEKYKKLMERKDSAAINASRAKKVMLAGLDDNRKKHVFKRALQHTALAATTGGLGNLALAGHDALKASNSQLGRRILAGSTEAVTTGFGKGMDWAQSKMGFTTGQLDDSREKDHEKIAARLDYAKANGVSDVVVATARIPSVQARQMARERNQMKSHFDHLQARGVAVTREDREKYAREKMPFTTFATNYESEKRELARLVKAEGAARAKGGASSQISADERMKIARDAGLSTFLKGEENGVVFNRRNEALGKAASDIAARASVATSSSMASVSNKPKTSLLAGVSAMSAGAKRMASATPKAAMFVAKKTAL